jgi:hypothetical protein
MLAIDDELRSYFEKGLSVSVATRNADLLPYALRGWGQHLSSDGRTLDVFIDRPIAARAISDLRDNGRLAVVFTDVFEFRSIQVKGRCVEVGDPEPDDWPFIEHHREAFTDALTALGFQTALVRNFWSTQVVKLRMVIEEFYDQTPGPGAGRKL